MTHAINEPDPAVDPAADTIDEPDGADKLGDAGKQALDRMKAQRNAAQTELKAAQARLKDIEDGQKTETEKLADAKSAAEQRAATATARAVKAEVKALAADTFADASDAAAFLDTGKYVGADGDVDVDAIKADLAELLTSKPHLAKPTGPNRPRPDPGQGGRGPVTVTDFTKATPEEYAAEAAKYRIRPRTPQ